MRRDLWAAALIVALLLAYWVIACAAVATKSLTYDEPLHATSAYLIRWDNDLRMDPENPVGFKRIAGLGMSRDDLRVDPARPEFHELLRNPGIHWPLTEQLVFGTPGVRPAEFAAHARSGMALTATSLGAVLSLWAWRLARTITPGASGALAGMLATAAYAFEPTFLGHGPLIKTDVPLAFGTVLAAYALWELGRCWRIGWLLLFAAGLSLTATAKYSGLPLVALLLGLLLARSAFGGPWPFRLPMSRQVELATPRRRLRASTLTTVAATLLAWAGIWAIYDFRFAPAPDGSLFDTASALQSASESNGGTAPPIPARVMGWAERQHLLPQTYAFGFIRLYANVIRWNAYLLGAVREGGWWYYFPLAAMFKLPVGQLAFFALGGVVLLRGAAWNFRSNRGNGSFASDRAWGAVVLTAPLLLVIVGGLASPYQNGIRLMAPAIALAIPAAAVVCATAGVYIRRVATLAVVAIVVESITAYPNYIAFFNLPARFAGPVHLLGDSNLDWGQDLPALQQWQQAHPEVPLYYGGIGTSVPSAYGLRVRAFPGAVPGEPGEIPSGPGVAAISATCIQGIYENDELAKIYHSYRDVKPLTTLGGGTLMLYRLDSNGKPTGTQ